MASKYFDAVGASIRLSATDDEWLRDMAARGDGLGWTERDVANDVVEYAIRRLPAEADRGSSPGIELSRNGVRVSCGHDLNGVLETFENHAKIDMAFGATEGVFVHAGVVAWRGSAILLPGRSRSGKSTLVAALIGLGAEYYSDEFAVLTTNGRVRPYAIKLSLRGLDGRPARRVSADALGGRAGVDAIPVGLIVVTEHRPRARWRPRPVPLGQAMLALMNNTVAATRPPDVTMPVLRAAVLDARAIESPRGEARRVAPRLLAEVL